MASDPEVPGSNLGNGTTEFLTVEISKQKPKNAAQIVEGTRTKDMKDPYKSSIVDETRTKGIQNMYFKKLMSQAK